MRGRNSHVSHFKPGVSGNPGGKPVGTRNAFSAAFVGDLHASWAQHGPNVLERVAGAIPAGRNSNVLGNERAADAQQRLPGGMSAQDLEIFSAIKAAIPDANDRQPGEVFNYVLEAVRSHSAKVIEG